MATSRMTFIAEGKTILFSALMSGPELLEQLAFTNLIGLRFNGKAESLGTVLMGDQQTYGLVQVHFEDHINWSDARAHCYAHLDEDGRVERKYKGALDRSDPGLYQARKLLKELKAA